MIRFYDGASVERWLDMPGCIAAVRGAMAQFSAAGTVQPLRQITPMAPGKLFAVMPGRLEAPGGMGAKVLTAYDDDERPGRSVHRGIVVLFDRASGEPVAVAEAGAITLVRTAAASAVATDAMARSDARTAAVFGTGEQARAHLVALPLVRKLDQIVVWGRDPAAGRALVDAMAGRIPVPLRFEPDPRAAARADIICTVTGSAEPVLRSDWVADGTHVNIVGSSHAGPVEIDDALVARGHYIADSRASALAAAAEFLKARDAGLIEDTHLRGEIGEVLNGTAPGRPDAASVTIYKSLGHVVQDLAALTYIHRRACDAGEEASA